MIEGSQRHRAVFLDRDGVINELVSRGGETVKDSPRTPAELQLLPRVGDAIRMIHEMGFLAIVVSNQPGIAKGQMEPRDLEAIDLQLTEDLRFSGAYLDSRYYCLHHPEAVLQEYRKECQCRKPRPGMILQAARDFGVDLRASVMIGDGIRDIIAGDRAGCMTILVAKRPQDHAVQTGRMPRPRFCAPDLQGAIELLSRHPSVAAATASKSPLPSED